MRTVGVASGYTSQNIGNAFFQLGGESLLRRAAMSRGIDIRLQPVPDVPGNWTLRRKTRGNPSLHFDILGHTEGLDLLVIQGPSLSWYVNEFWNDTLASLRDRGTTVALLGVAFYRFDDAEVSQARRFLADNPVVAISTRDSESARILRGFDLAGTPIHDGIDSGFWLPHAFEPLPLRGGPYVAVTFDRYREPRLLPSVDADRILEIDPDGRRGRLFNALAKRGKAQAYLAAMMDRVPRPKRVGRYTIIRPEHRSNPPMHWKAYLHPNGLMSDEPWSYLTTYANAELTVSDRVHACVAALAYGNRAILMNESPRGGLLDRVAPVPRNGAPRRALDGLIDELRDTEERFVINHVFEAL